MLQFSLANIAIYKSLIDKSHMIYGFGSLFWVIPELPQHIFSMLPAIFKAILVLCEEANKYNSLDDEEQLCYWPIPVYYKAKDHKIIEGSCSSESDGDINAEIYFLFKNYENTLYHSPFLNLYQTKLIKDIVQNLGWSYPEIMNSIKRLLTKNEGEFVNSLIQ